jgi:hypothetical protein
VFAGGGKRTAQLRSLALSAFSAAREADDPAAAAAARAAGLAASCAYTHPLADVQQTKHIVGPAAYAALALELNHGGDPNIGEGEVRWAIEHAFPEVREVLQQMPARQPGNSRLDTLLYELDAGIRSRALPENAYQQVSSFLNQHTGELITLRDEEIQAAEQDEALADDSELEPDEIQTAQDVLSSTDYLPLPSQFEIHEYAIMQRFCVTIDDADLSRELQDQIQGTGAFRRFKDTLYRHNQIEGWFAYRQAAFADIAMEWLEEHHIPYVRDEREVRR